MLVLVYRGCSTCLKALKWLDQNEISYIERPIVEMNPTYEELDKWIKMSSLPVEKFFNTSGKIYKEMNLKVELTSKTYEEKVELLSSNGKLCKRPLVIGDNFVLVGFKEAEWKERLKK